MNNKVLDGNMDMVMKKVEELLERRDNRRLREIENIFQDLRATYLAPTSVRARSIFQNLEYLASKFTDGTLKNIRSVFSENEEIAALNALHGLSDLEYYLRELEEESRELRERIHNLLVIINSYKAGFKD